MDVTIVIVTYNSEFVITDALMTLAADENVIIWDNGSTDNTLAAVRSVAPNALILSGDENLGFAKAVNRAIRTYGKKTKNNILLLNPDARISRDSIVALIGLLDANHDVGIVAPHVQQPLGRASHKVLEVGRSPNLWRVLTHWSGLSRLARWVPALEGVHLRPADAPFERDVDWVSGACLLVRRSTWEALGGLTERWFMYAEDTDFCIRAGQSGWRIRYWPNVIATHEVGASSTPPAGERSVNSDWVLNLFDLYKSELSANQAASLAWKLTVSGGLASRSAVYWLLASIFRSEARRRQAQDFMIHSRRLLMAPTRRRRT